MRRRLFNFTAAVSLAMCLATVALWARSGLVEDDVGRVHRIYINHDTALVFYTGLISTNGSVGVERQREYFQPDRRLSEAEWPEAVQWIHYSRSAIGLNRYALNSLGFHSWSMGSSNTTYERYQFVPIAPIIVVLAVLPLWWFIRRQRYRMRIANNLCQSCGYNLTGNTSGVYPECGTAIQDQRIKKSAGAK